MISNSVSNSRLQASGAGGTTSTRRPGLSVNTTTTTTTAGSKRKVTPKSTAGKMVIAGTNTVKPKPKLKPKTQISTTSTAADNSDTVKKPDADNKKLSTSEQVKELLERDALNQAKIEETLALARQTISDLKVASNSIEKTMEKNKETKVVLDGASADLDRKWEDFQDKFEAMNQKFINHIGRSLGVPQSQIPQGRSIKPSGRSSSSSSSNGASSSSSCTTNSSTPPSSNETTRNMESIPEENDYDTDSVEENLHNSCPEYNNKHKFAALDALGKHPTFVAEYHKYATRDLEPVVCEEAGFAGAKKSGRNSFAGSKKNPNTTISEVNTLKLQKVKQACHTEINRDFPIRPKTESGDWLSEHKEGGQTVQSFVRRCVGMNAKPHPKIRNVIYIQPLGTKSMSKSSEINNMGLLRKDSMFLGYLQTFLEAWFLGMDVVILPYEKVDVTARENFSSPQNHQIHAGEVIRKELPRLRTKHRDSYAFIGVTMEDLYPREEWNFVFGLADMMGRNGVFSFARYDNNSKNDKMRCARLLKSAVKVMGHELCHCFGLKHCIYFNCVMQGSNSAEESSKKFFELCPCCLKKTFFAVEFDVVERYRALNRWMEDLIETNPDFAIDSNGYGEVDMSNSNCYSKIFGPWSAWYKRRIATIESGVSGCDGFGYEDDSETDVRKVSKGS